MTDANTSGGDAPLLDYEFRHLASDAVVNLGDEYSGKVLLIVNVASRCGLTPQYAGLEKLYTDYRDAGLEVLGFPSNDFLGQEPGSEEEIQSFCDVEYKIDFPMFEKISVKDDGAHPFYQALAAAAGTYPTWNFHKYLVGRDGRLIREFGPKTEPADEALLGRIEAALKD